MNSNNINIPTPRNTQDLRRLLNQYGRALSPDNRNLLLEVIRHVEGGADKGSLQNLLGRVQQQAAMQQGRQNAPPPPQPRTPRPRNPRPPHGQRGR